MDKFYMYQFDEQVIEKYLDIKKRNSDLQLVACSNKNELLSEDFLKEANQLIQYTSSKGIQPHDIIFSIESADADMSPTDWQKTKEVCKELQKKGVDFKISDYNYLWSIDEVENANNQITESADKIREKKFSPLEKLMSAYFEVTKRNYTREGKTDHFAQSRSVYGVLNSDSIVCVGFSALLKAIIEKEGDPNIKLEYNRIDCSRDGIYSDGLHQNLIAYIKDDKYNIDGYYYLDPTWDASIGNRQFNLNYFLVPLQDIQHIKTKIVPMDKRLRKRPVQEKTKQQPHITKKEQKANASATRKNKYKLFDYISPIVASGFSGEKLVPSKSLTTVFRSDSKFMSNLHDNLDISNDLVNMVYNDKNSKQIAVENYLQQNKINYLSNEDVSTLNGLIRKDLSIEDCMDYARKIVENMRGKEFQSEDDLKKTYLQSVRSSLEKLKMTDIDENNINLFDSLGDKDFLDQQYDSLEEKLSDIDKTINLLDEYFDKNPESVYLFNDFEKMTNTPINNIALQLSSLTNLDQQSVNEVMNEKNGVYKNILSNIYREFKDNKILYRTELTPQERQQVDYLILQETAYSSSEPINLMSITRAITNVIAKSNPNANREDINKAVNFIIEENTKRAEKKFDSNAINAFSVYNQQKQEFNRQQDTGR